MTKKNGPKKPLPPEAEEWARKINAAWARVQDETRQIKSLSKQGKTPAEIVKIEKPLVEKLQALGHVVRRQVRCAGGRIDVLDETAGEIIECKADGCLQSLVDAAKQLKSYQPSYPLMRLCIAVPFIDPSAMWMADALRTQGFRFIEMEADR